MSDPVQQAHDNDRVRALIAEVESERLVDELGGLREHTRDEGSASGLRVAASLALADLIGGNSVDHLLRELSSPGGLDHPEAARSAFEKWDAYLSALLSNGMDLESDELVLYAAAGLCAQQQVEVRSVLRGTIAHQRPIPSDAGRIDWSDLVRIQINTALLLVIRQSDRDDLRSTNRLIDALADQQSDFESEWLEGTRDQAIGALSLLGYYHVARAVSRIAEFLLAGSVESEGAFLKDIGPELRRLLTQADQYLSVSIGLEGRFWLNAITVILWTLRTDSIWISGRGISDRLDQLLRDLAQGERERNVFSLLPSQQEAIRKNLMDSSRVAVVLQMPTSSGKTLLAEFAILQTIDAFKNQARVLYIVPTRALATQVFRTLTEDLRPLGIEVFAAASAFEEDPFELELLRGTDGVIVATPEKVDLLLRSHPEWFDQLRLVVVDEAHLLNDSERGVRLELLLANLRRERPESRSLLLTPFIDNAKEIAAWLGGARGLPITVQWRPMRLLLGIAELQGRRTNTSFLTRWKEPYGLYSDEKRVRIPAGIGRTQLSTTRSRVSFFARRFRNLGSVLALYSGSKQEPEQLASEVAAELPEIPEAERSPALRVAIALAEEEFGEASVLGKCLRHGVAYHHAALSPILRYLVEDQIRSRHVQFVAATTTLAQGMNFPIAVVIIHSVHKPHGKGNLTSSEFWNIAGRAGRVGLAEKGLVLFANENHLAHWHRYARTSQAEIRSALLDVLVSIGSVDPIKEQYRKYEELRPFIQYLAHAAASSSPRRALDDLEELLQGSLANAQVQTDQEARALRAFANNYLREISRTPVGFLKVGDRTGLGSFSFNELYSKIRESFILRGGPLAIVQQCETGLQALVEALRWLPELDLAIGYGTGSMDVRAVARVVQGWLDGRRIVDLANEFPGDSHEDRIRNAATYLFSTVSQTVAWGAHAYLRGWGFGQPEGSKWEESEGAMLPAYIQHGVHTPEAAVCSLMSVPRQVAEPMAEVFRARFGPIRHGKAGLLREFIETADEDVWSRALSESSLRASPSDLQVVWRQMRGLPLV